ncbi:EF hand [Actinomadura rubteroloni]|uniref:EF hand n=1 Tax=Actinomadura rubteroloni TaxID=1926885 RepID=A0A2P4UEQ2_9ACTN|nr:oxygenase MpaB family protein [Actinomadura rubteroloni]POM23511.1 EF hand [Actinomadura rubteroloni]
MTDPLDHEQRIELVRKFGSGSLLRKLSSELRWGLAAVRATALEAAHPQVGGALLDHSTFAAHPWRRLFNTITSVDRLVDEDVAVQLREVDRLNRLHARITGTDEQGRAYSALDGDARAWVIATLYDSTVEVCRLTGTPLTVREEGRLYEEFKALLTVLQGRDDLLPPTPAEFRAYFAAMVAEQLEDNAAVQAILHELFATVPAPPLLKARPALWAVARAMIGPVASAVTLASLPETFRARHGYTAPPGADALMRGGYFGVGVITMLLPPSLSRSTVVIDILDPSRESTLGPIKMMGLLMEQAAKAQRLLRPRHRAPASRDADRLFHEVLDQTGDGRLTWPDLAAMAREIATRLDLDEPAETRLFGAFAAWWQELLAAMDADGDEVVTRAEFAAGAAALSGPALAHVAEVLFEAADKDGSGTISAEEYRLLFRSGFQRDVETTGTGDITSGAFVAEFLSFMTGRVPSSACDNLLATA